MKTNLADLLYSLPSFTGLRGEEVTRIADCMVARSYERDEVITFEGQQAEGLYILLSGRVKMTKTTADGKEHILDILHSGQLFGGEVFLRLDTYTVTVEALTPVKVGFLHNSYLENLVRTIPEFAWELIVFFNGRLLKSYDQVLDLAANDTQTRMAGVLLKLGAEHGIETPEGIRMDLSLTHQELANLIGTSRETVTRILKTFKDKGAVKIDGRGIVIKEDKLAGLM